MPERKPARLELHGDVRIDNYFWLKERDNPDVIAYLDAENAYTEKIMAPMQGMQEILLQGTQAAQYGSLQVDGK